MASKMLTVRDLPPDGLAPFHVRHAEIVAQTPRVMTKQERLAILHETARLPDGSISKKYLEELERRPDYVVLLQKLRASQLDLARSLLEGMLPEAVRTRRLAVEEMSRRLEEAPSDADLRLVPGLTDPLLERAWPKKTDTNVTAVAVNISLSPKQTELLSQGEYIVEAEVIEPEKESE